MIDEHELTRRVAESFRAHADEVTLADEPFDPTRRMPQPLTEATSPGRGRVLLLAAAITVVAGLGVTTWLVDDDGGTDDPTTITPSMHTPPTDVLAPGWVPDGWDLTHANWSADPAANPFIGAELHHGDQAQLFGDPDDPTRGLLLESDGYLEGEAFPAGTDVTIRGVPGGAQTADQPINLRFRPAGVEYLDWTENDRPLRASYRGLSRAEAIALLDGMRPDATGGFELGADSGGLRELAEVVDPPEAPGQTGLVYEPPDGVVGAGPFLTVGTSTPTGSPTVTYLATWLTGERAADGTATAWDPRGWYKIARPDGTLIDVSLQTLELDDEGYAVAFDPYDIPGVGAAKDVTRQVAESVASISPDDFAELDHNAQQASADLPLLASVEVPTGTVQVRGRGQGEVFCLIVGGQSRCTQRGEAYTLDGVMTGDLALDDQRYALGASQVRSPVIRVGDTGEIPVASEDAVDGDWRIVLAAVPADEAVSVE